ncbi:MAG: RimK family alpha-L-glutamate ligase [Bacilli bacterium]|nr:RimK family alpha-L-glutamate ligase [Bacilli bacterium]
MRGFILNNGFYLSPAQDHKRLRLKEEFNKLGIDIDLLTSVDLNFSIQDSHIHLKNIEKYDFCVYLDKDENLAYAIQKFIPIFNSAQSIASCNDKVETYLKLVDSNLPMPKTIPSLLCYNLSNSQADIKKFLDYVETELSYPLICKQCYGSLGLEVYLINNRQELEQKYAELIKLPLLFQKYISNFRGKDYRIFTIGGKAVASMLRQNETDFRSNIFLGGKGTAVELPQDILSVAENASRALGLTYAGCDVMLDENGQPTLIEVNSNAFLSGIEKASKINITKMLVNYIVSLLKAR